MDAKFFATLKLIAAAEKTHNFRSRSYDVAALALKHPQNVISVAPANNGSELKKIGLLTSAFGRLQSQNLAFGLWPTTESAFS